MPTRRWRLPPVLNELNGPVPPGTRVLLVDGAGSSTALASVLRTGGYETHVARDPGRAEELVRRADPFDAAVVLATRAGSSALSTVRNLLTSVPLCRSLVVVDPHDGETCRAALQAGAHAFFEGDTEPTGLRSAVADTVRSTHRWRNSLRQAANTGGLPSPAMRREDALRSVDLDLRHMVARLQELGSLTPIQTLTAWRLLWGDPHAEIGKLLGCSTRTVKHHVGEILARTGARNRHDLLRILLEDGGVRDPWALLRDTAEQDP